jgi:hypothetical protein
MCRGTSHKLMNFDAVAVVISVVEHDTLEDAEDIHEIILREAFENVESYLKNV